jgi:hypothetical protein
MEWDYGLSFIPLGPIGIYSNALKAFGGIG